MTDRIRLNFPVETCDATSDSLSAFGHSHVQFISLLKVQPEPCLNAQPLFQSYGGIRRHGTFTSNELVYPVGGDVDGPCKVSSTHSKLFQLVSQYRTWMDWVYRPSLGRVHGFSLNGNRQFRCCMASGHHPATRSKHATAG